MKKIYALLMVMMAFFAQTVCAETLLTPDPNKTYLIQHSSGMFLTKVETTGSAAQLKYPGDGPQKFTITPVEGVDGTYNIKLADGDYLGSDNAKKGYKVVFLTDPSDSFAQYTFGQATERDHCTIYNVGRQGCLGTDKNEESTGVFTNKNGKDGKHAWKFVEAPEGVIYNMLNKAITRAEAALDGIEIGNKPDMYPQEAVNALNTAIETAKNLLTSQDQTAVNEGTKTLNAAVSTFSATKIAPQFMPLPNTAYRFSVRKTIDKFLTSNGTDAKTTSEFASKNNGQHWTFQPVEGQENIYIVKNEGKALAYDGTVSEVADTDAPQWTTVYCTTIDGFDYFALVEATDPTKVLTFSKGTTLVIQTLKKSEIAHQGLFLRVDPTNDPNLKNLELAVAKAKATLKNAKRGEKPGQWSEEACNALQAVITPAATLTGATQEQVDAKVTEVNDAVNTFNQSANPSHDLTKINALIAEAEAYIAENNVENASLNAALEAAKNIVADSDNYTPTEVQTAHDNLSNILNSVTTGVNSIATEDVTILTGKGNIMISGLEGACTIMVSGIDGRMISNVRTADAEYSISLATGCYVVAVQAEGFATSRVVMVK